MKAFIAPWQARYSALTTREKRAVLCAAAALAALLSWWVAVQPAWQARARLEQTLPVLRTQAAELAGLAAQGAVRRVPPNAEPVAVLNASLSAAGFAGQPATRLDEGRIQIRLPSTDYARILRWWAEIQAQYGVRIDSVNVHLIEAGRVNAELVVFWPHQP